MLLSVMVAALSSRQKKHLDLEPPSTGEGCRSSVQRVSDQFREIDLRWLNVAKLFAVAK
jgi:hypothetical protein